MPEVTFHLRQARPEDALAVPPLIYSSGPEAFDFVFNLGDKLGPREFISRTFREETAEFGYGTHIVAESEGRIVAAGAAWSGGNNVAWTVHIARQIIAQYGMSAGGVMIRGLRLERLVKPPTKTMQYIGHLGVDSSIQSQGIGTAMVERFVEEGRRQGKATAELDVAVNNPNAQRLYERLGFEVAEELESALSRKGTNVPNMRRMVLPL